MRKRKSMPSASRSRIRSRRCRKISRRRYDDYQKKEAMMNDASKKAEQQKLVELERRAKNTSRKSSDRTASSPARPKRSSTRSGRRSRRPSPQVAKEEKYSFVFDKTEQIQVLLYGDPNQDITLKSLTN